MTEAPRFDTIEGCVKELSELNREVAEIAADWSREAGELKRLETTYKRLYREAMRGTSGSNADERASTAHLAVEESYRKIRGLDEDAPGLSESIEALVGKVETNRVLFATIERRASNVQSIIRLRREEAKLDPFVPREGR